MTMNFVAKGTELIQIAISKDDEEDYESALSYYSKGIEYLLTGKKYEKNEKIINAINNKVAHYLKRAEDIKESLNNNKQIKEIQKEKDQDKDQKMNDNDDDEENNKLKKGLMSAIVESKPNVTWEDIAGLDTAKQLLQEAVVLPTAFPHLFNKKRKPFQGILLYGPAGTGKSYLAQAVASVCEESTFFSISSADLISKFVGESEKLIKHLFEMARYKKPSIIFIDEIDSLATKRGDDESSSTRRVKTELLVQMQGGVGKDCSGVLTLGATNCPWDLDPAVRRRFVKRIYIPLPGSFARKQMFKIHCNGCNDNDNDNDGLNDDGLNDDDFTLLSEKTDGFSGSDIAAVVQDAMMEPVRTLQSATHFKKIIVNDKNNNKDDDNDSFVWIACSPGDGNAVKMNLMDFKIDERDKVQTEPLKLSHFLRVLKTAKATVCKDDIQRHIDWTTQFGEEGN